MKNTQKTLEAFAREYRAAHERNETYAEFAQYLSAKYGRPFTAKLCKSLAARVNRALKARWVKLTSRGVTDGTVARALPQLRHEAGFIAKCEASLIPANHEALERAKANYVPRIVIPSPNVPLREIVDDYSELGNLT